MIDIESRMLAVIQQYEPCSIQDIREHMPECSREAVETIKKRLAASARIANIGTVSSGRWAIARPGIQTAKAKPKPKPSKKPPPPTDNLAPGRLISKMAGVYVPPKPSMRPGALDHQAHMSLHAGVSKPYTGQPLTLGVRAK